MVRWGEDGVHKWTWALSCSDLFELLVSELSLFADSCVVVFDELFVGGLICGKKLGECEVPLIYVHSFLVAKRAPLDEVFGVFDGCVFDDGFVDEFIEPDGFVQVDALGVIVVDVLEYF